MENGIIRVSVCCFAHDGSGKYVILKRSRGARDEWEMWEPCAGGLKFGENVEDAVRREVREELGTELLDIEFMGYGDVHRVQDGKPTHWVRIDFRGRVDPAEAKIGEPHKCDEIRWVTIEELDNFPEPLHSQFPAYLEKYRHRL